MSGPAASRPACLLGSSLTCLALATGAGCSPRPRAGADAATSLAETTSGSAGHAVQLCVADAEGLREVLRSHRGKVALVDFWATWCAPCRAQFPYTVALARKHGPAGLRVISVSLDDPADHAKALEFLRKQGAAFDNLLSKDGASEKSVASFDLIGGSIPQYKLFDRSGKLRRSFHHDPSAGRQFTPEDIERSVKELLTETRAVDGGGP